MSNDLQRKNEIQKELNKLAAGMADLAKRKVKLITDREALIKSIANRSDALSEALIDFQDTTKISDALARDNASLEGLNKAITLIDQRLADLKNQHSENEKLLLLVDVNRLADEASLEFLEIIDKLYAVNTALNNLDKKFSEINVVGSPAGFRIDLDDHLRNLGAMYRYLRGDHASATDSISYKLSTIEDSYKADLLIARNKRGK